MHTPGPWTFEPQDGEPLHCIAAQVFGPDGVSIAVIEPSQPDASTADDTAKLIAASPELFEAALTMAHAEDSGGDGWWRGFAMLKAALKKAGGQFPSMDQI